MWCNLAFQYFDISVQTEDRDAPPSTCKILTFSREQYQILPISFLMLPLITATYTDLSGSITLFVGSVWQIKLAIRQLLAPRKYSVPYRIITHIPCVRIHLQSI